MGGTAEAFFRPIGGMEEASFFHSSLNYESSASAQQKQDAAVQLSEAGEILTIVRTKYRRCDCVNRARREREDKMEEKTTMTKEMVTYVAAHERVDVSGVLRGDDSSHALDKVVERLAVAPAV